MKINYDILTVGLIVFMVSDFCMALVLKKGEHGIVKKIISVILLLSACASGIAILFTSGTIGGCRAKGPDINYIAYESARAFILGKYLAETYPNSKVLVITGTLPASKELKDKQLESLKEGLAPSSYVTAVETLEVSGNRRGRIMLSDKVGYAKFENAIDSHADCDMVVTFIGFPNDVHKMKLWDKGDSLRPKVALLDGPVRNLGTAIKNGLVCAATATMPFWTYDPLVPEDPAKKFEQRYLLIVPDNVEEISKRYNNFISLR